MTKNTIQWRSIGILWNCSSNVGKGESASYKIYQSFHSRCQEKYQCGWAGDECIWRDGGDERPGWLLQNIKGLDTRMGAGPCTSVLFGFVGQRKTQAWWRIVVLKFCIYIISCSFKSVSSTCNAYTVPPSVQSDKAKKHTNYIVIIDLDKMVATVSGWKN